MLEVYPRISRSIQRAERRGDSLWLFSEVFRYRLEPKNDHILRITVTGKEDFSTVEKPGVQFTDGYGGWSFREEETVIRMDLGGMQLLVDKETGSFSYLDKNGNCLLQERKKDSKVLEEFTFYRLAGEDTLQKEVIQTADGKKEVIKAADRVEAGKLYHTHLFLEWQEEERLYGLGQQEEGICNLRGRTVYVHQANRKIAVPMLVSDLGYGILMDTYSPLIFNDTEYGSYLYTEADWELDYYFMNGGSMQGVIRDYRFLTGKAAMLPRWAFGYLQSQERYETQEEILAIAKQYRERGLGLDCLVLDWCSWEDGRWGQKSFDKIRFSDVEHMVRELHEQDIHFMLSIWPNMDENCDDYKEFQKEGLLLPGSNVYNAMAPEGRKLYWKQVERGLFSRGVDAWWCDSSEGYTPEWNHLKRPEPFQMYTEFCGEAGNHIPAWQTNAFSLYHAQSVYEGQREAMKPDAEEKRVCNLTRSAYTGQQRYGTILWSGDIGASWETLRKQIGAGLSFCASGLPYWTVDIGAFFVKTGEPWYWDGEYPDTTKDLGYRELFVRWFQWGCFLPVFRGHGTDCRRELWEFAAKEDLAEQDLTGQDKAEQTSGEQTSGEQNTAEDGEEKVDFYGALVRINQLRYQLLPYIYSTAGRVWLEDASFISLLAMAFPEDREAAQITDQYLFGEDIMVCPVTNPMYYEKGSKAIQGAPKTRRVYLPKGQGWYDFWTRRYYEGGTWIDAPAPIDRIPLFVKEGAIIPMTEFAASTAARQNISLHIFSGRDGRLLLYEDAGDGYGYERGEYSLREWIWIDERDFMHVEQLAGSEEKDYVAHISNIEKIALYERELKRHLDNVERIKKSLQEVKKNEKTGI